MSPELIAILAVGVSLAGLMWQSMRRMEARLEARIDGLKGELDETKRELGARIDGLKGELDETKRDLRGSIDDLRNELGARIDGQAEEMREIRDRLGRLEGKMDFVHDYIMHRSYPAPAAE